MVPRLAVRMFLCGLSAGVVETELLKYHQTPALASSACQEVMNGMLFVFGPSYAPC